MNFFRQKTNYLNDFGEQPYSRRIAFEKEAAVIYPHFSAVCDTLYPFFNISFPSDNLYDRIYFIGVVPTVREKRRIK